MFLNHGQQKKKTENMETQTAFKDLVLKVCSETILQPLFLSCNNCGKRLFRARERAKEMPQKAAVNSKST